MSNHINHKPRAVQQVPHLYLLEYMVSVSARWDPSVVISLRVRFRSLHACERGERPKLSAENTDLGYRYTVNGERVEEGRMGRMRVGYTVVFFFETSSMAESLR